MTRFAVDDVLAKEVGTALGVPTPGSVDDIGALYRAWVAAVPFDPVAKAAALAAESAIPGSDPTEVCERWLATGVGSTCWGLCTGLAGLLGAAGIDSWIGVERMRREDVVDLHSFVVLDLDGEPHAVDPVFPTGAPLPLRDGAEGGHPALASRVCAVDGRLEHHVRSPAFPRLDGARYTVLSTALDRGDVAAFCELSRHSSGIRAGSLFWRSAPAGGLRRAGPDADGHALVITTWTGGGAGDDRRIPDLDASLAALGYHGDARALLARAGFLDGDPWTPPPRGSRS